MSKHDTLVLSSGGIKGISMIGALHCLNEFRMTSSIQTYIGCSAGSLLCYLLAIGYSPVDILVSPHTITLFEKIKYFDLVGMVHGYGSIDYTPIGQYLEKMTLEKLGKFVTMKQLQEEYKITFISVTYNMTLCQTEYVGSHNYPDLPSLIAVRMSVNIPLVFDRFKYFDNYFLDGAMADNFPIMFAQTLESSKKIIGLYFNINEQSLKDRPEDGILSYLSRLMQIGTIQRTKDALQKVEKDRTTIFAIDVKGDAVNQFDFHVKNKQRLQMFYDGYSSIRPQVEKYIQEQVEERKKNAIIINWNDKQNLSEKEEERDKKDLNMLSLST